jgi:alpha-1,3-rhamnosyl/mannosyltransferase
MACGTPVVASNRASLPEVVGDAAAVCDALDVDALAQAIERLLVDDAAAARLRAAGPARAATFTWARCAAAHRDLYLELLRG